MTTDKFFYESNFYESYLYVISMIEYYFKMTVSLDVISSFIT